jgi:thiol-disulfide isomerase/thioredoxin
VFNPDEKNIFDSQMIINQKSQNINGTVRTETGDYGYMEGVVRGNRFSMSNFNGYRAYMMDGYLNKDTLSGYLYTGNYNAVPFKGFKDAGFELPDPYGLTKMKDGYNEFKFSFENTEGQIVSNSDKKFDKKITLIQLMGSWCPNCLDESRYLSKLVEKFDDIMLVSIAFEFAKNKEQALNNLKKLKNRLNINYDLLLAQYGSSDKSIALEKLESLDTLISYPTLIVVDKNKKVRRIHTGFNGPATGIKYEDFKKDFEELIVSLSIN